MAEEETKSTIYIDIEDDISTIIDKMEEASKKVVALVLPKRSAALQSTVNMRLLKQSAEKADKKVVLVTNEDALLPLAGAVGLPVAKNLQSAPEIPDGPAVPEVQTAATASPSAVPEDEEPYANSAKEPAKEETAKKPLNVRREASVGALTDAHERKEPETVELDDEPANAEQTTPAAKAGPSAMAGVKMPKVKVPNFERFRLSLIMGVGGLLALIVFLYLALAVLPRGTINITTSSTPVALNMNLTSSGSAKKLDTTNNIIPSSVQTYKQTAKKTIKATGQQNVGSKATGSVTLSIPCRSATTFPYKVPAGTRLDSANGLVFVTQDTASLSSPGGGGGCSFSGSADVIAAKSGTDYNVAPTSFTSEDNSDVTGQSSSAMTGGSNKIITVVSQQDLSSAVTAISNDSSQPSKDDTTKQFKQNVDSQGYYILESTLKVSAPTPSSSPTVGSQATSAVVTVTTTYSALAVKKDDLTKLITGYANKQIDTNKQKIDLTDILTKAKVDVASQSSPTDAALTVSGNIDAVPLLDATTIKKDAAGKKKGDITAEVSNWPGVKSVDVRLSPFWVSKVPSKQSKITVNIQAANGSN